MLVARPAAALEVSLEGERVPLILEQDVEVSFAGPELDQIVLMLDAVGETPTGTVRVVITDNRNSFEVTLPWPDGARQVIWSSVPGLGLIDYGVNLEFVTPAPFVESVCDEAFPVFCLTAEVS